jgi:hypothetical protein
MTMAYIAIGIDAAKGRADIAMLNESPTRLHGGVYDDTACLEVTRRPRLQPVFEGVLQLIVEHFAHDFPLTV